MTTAAVFTAVPASSLSPLAPLSSLVARRTSILSAVDSAAPGATADPHQLSLFDLVDAIPARAQVIAHPGHVSRVASVLDAARRSA